MDEPYVCLHGWTMLPSGDLEYVDFELEPELVMGYSVYLRVPTPDDPQQPFDIRDEKDCDTLEEARSFASELALLRDVKHIEEY